MTNRHGKQHDYSGVEPATKSGNLYPSLGKEYSDTDLSSSGTNNFEQTKPPRSISGSIVHYGMNLIIWGITQWIKDLLNTAKYVYDTLAVSMDMYSSDKSRREIAGYLTKRVARYFANKYVKKFLVGSLVVVVAVITLYIRFIR